MTLGPAQAANGVLSKQMNRRATHLLSTDHMLLGQGLRANKSLLSVTY